MNLAQVQNTTVPYKDLLLAKLILCVLYTHSSVYVQVVYLLNMNLLRSHYHSHILFITTAYQNLVGNPQPPFDTLTNNTITVGVVSQTSLSFLRTYFDGDNVYPFFTAIIDVEDGVIRGITWDDSCVFCNSKNCLETTYNFNGEIQDSDSAGQPTSSCYITKEACDQLVQDNPAATECDLTLYVVWSGTDRHGKALQSQAFRFSAFPVQDLSERLASAIPTFNVGNPFA